MLVLKALIKFNVFNSFGATAENEQLPVVLTLQMSLFAHCSQTKKGSTGICFGQKSFIQTAKYI